MIRVKAISLWEPWASLMRCGAKTIETRSWATTYRGPILICAARKWSHSQTEYLETDRVQAALRDPDGHRPVLITDMLFGMAAVLVDLMDCRPTISFPNYPCWPEFAFGDFSPGRFGWETKRRTLITPFPVAGRQGLFNVIVPPNIEVEWPNWARSFR